MCRAQGGNERKEAGGGLWVMPPAVGGGAPVREASNSTPTADQIRLDLRAQLHCSTSTQTRARLHSSTVKRADQVGAPLLS